MKKLDPLHPFQLFNLFIIIVFAIIIAIPTIMYDIKDKECKSTIKCYQDSLSKCRDSLYLDGCINSHTRDFLSDTIKVTCSRNYPENYTRLMTDTSLNFTYCGADAGIERPLIKEAFKQHRINQ